MNVCIWHLLWNNYCACRCKIYFKFGLIAHVFFFRPVFTVEQEKELAEHVLFMERRLFGLTKTDLRRLAYEFATSNGIQNSFNANSKMAGPDWMDGFFRRHPDLSLRKPVATSVAKGSGFNKMVVGKFFKLLESMYDQYGFTASRIFSVDETGMSTVPSRSSSIVSLRGKKQVGTLTSAERGTAVICLNAAGHYIPPMLIFPRKNVNPGFQVGTPPDSLIVAHPSGRMQMELFAPTWFDHFLQHTKPTANDPVLLILDGHATHAKNLQFIDLARKNHVHLLVMPPHVSHRLQPLDVTFMAPLKTNYEQQVKAWLRDNPGKVVTIYQVGLLFGMAYNKAASAITSVNGFRKTGIFPLKEDIFHEYVFAAADTTVSTDMPLDDLPTNKPDEFVTVVPGMDDSFDEYKLCLSELPGVGDPVTMHKTQPLISSDSSDSEVEDTGT